METQNCEFHKIKVASKSAEKDSGSVAMHFRYSLFTMEATSLPAPAEQVLLG